MSLIVETATFPPGRCAVSGTVDGPFIDTGSDMFYPGRIYVSTVALRALAQEHLHMCDAGNHETLKQRCADLEEQIAALEDFKASVDRVFTALDRTPPKARRKPGPKPKGEGV